MAGDAYLRYLVEELKPAIDRDLRTLPSRDDTFVTGSSMGGLISLYAIAEYPQVFGGVAALSTHWPAGDGVMVDWFGAHLSDPATHRLYLDHGGATLDAAYTPYQQRIDALLRAGGYREGDNWITRTYPGAEHHERAWRERLDVLCASCSAAETGHRDHSEHRASIGPTFLRACCGATRVRKVRVAHAGTSCNEYVCGADRRRRCIEYVCSRRPASMATSTIPGKLRFRESMTRAFARDRGSRCPGEGIRCNSSATC